MNLREPARARISAKFCTLPFASEDLSYILRSTLSQQVLVPQLKNKSEHLRPVGVPFRSTLRTMPEGRNASENVKLGTNVPVRIPVHLIQKFALIASHQNSLCVSSINRTSMTQYPRHKLRNQRRCLHRLYF